MDSGAYLGHMRNQRQVHRCVVEVSAYFIKSGWRVIPEDGTLSELRDPVVFFVAGDDLG